jgi:hypothetical protein
MYDTGDFYNSYKGQPGTNITTGVGRNYDGYNRTTYDVGVFFETNGYTEVVNIPALGPTTVQSVEINNSAPGQACCPNLYNYTGGWMSPIWLPGQTYSYQIIYKCRSGYTHPNFMYHYEYTAGESYLTEYGVFTTDKQESLGDGWYHAWNTFTTNASAAKGYTGLWYYQYYVADKLSIAAVSISPGDTIRPPQQIIPSGTTRSATQGLLPIVGNSTINLSNVSFDSNAQIVFDGTDDFIDTDFPAITINNPTIEAVVYRNQSTGRYESIIQNNIAGDDALYVYPGGNLGFWPCVASNLSVPTGQWSYVAVSYDGSNLTYCVNGVTQVVSATCADITDWDFLRIGAYGTGDGERWIGKISVAKVYDRALSIDELKQNYNKYKTRFNLP